MAGRSRRGRQGGLYRRLCHVFGGFGLSLGLSHGRTDGRAGLMLITAVGLAGISSSRSPTMLASLKAFSNLNSRNNLRKRSMRGVRSTEEFSIAVTPPRYKSRSTGTEATESTQNHLRKCNLLTYPRWRIGQARLVPPPHPTHPFR